ncbi:hypothetical protein [Streptomyces nogalater]|uniref:HNH endonuclease n=1 Tax=Streptomyces nogalater TaxID=38314 RepID=A0ABW0WNF5_STRNO
MTSTTPIFPVRYWDGVPVPFITAWSQEQVPPQELLRVHHSGTTSLGLRGETDVERQFGVSWMRMPVTRGGRPQHGRVHALRQRQAMSRMLCQLCGGPTVGARKDEWTLFLAAGADGHPLLNGERTESPPVHAVCARLSVQHCPPLHHRGWTAALVRRTPVRGVAGLLYDPRTLERLPDAPQHRDGMHRVPFTDTRRIRWTLAARLVITLEDVVPVTDLDALVDDETKAVKISR